MRKQEHEGYAYAKREPAPRGAAAQRRVSICEIPPGQSACTYRYHAQNGEFFYILKGRGILRTPDGDTERRGRQPGSPHKRAKGFYDGE